MSDELTVKMGDVLKSVSKASEDGWLAGELNGKRGIFPSNFVKVGEWTYGFTHCGCAVFKHSVFHLPITGDTRLFNGRRQEGTAEP